jgi:MFS family permease
MVATWVPEAERSRAVATLGAGKTGGSIAGLLLAPVVIGAFGWQAMFYSFGVLGLFWAAVWWVKGQDREGNWAILFGPINLMQSNLFTLLLLVVEVKAFQ